MMKILLLVTGFASHVVWAEGYARQANRKKSGADIDVDVDVRVVTVPGDRWKFRMLCGGAELLQYISDDDDIIIVDGMLEMTVLLSGLQARVEAQAPAAPAVTKTKRHRPKVFVYLHENQITTPFVNNDRDKKAQRQWQYAMSHYRSLLTADGFIFNSHKHCVDFQQALPKVINEQCPRDVVEWHLETCKQLLQDKCLVLPYGLELEELRSLFVPSAGEKSAGNDESPHRHQAQPTTTTILWNARLEEDKDPGTFLEILKQVKQNRGRQSQDMEYPSSSSSSSTAQQIPSFQLIILGTDPSKDQIWYQRLKEEFETEIVHIGFCTERASYSEWLSKAHVVVSTAQHETFGISIVESVYMGAIPLLPRRLSYPEIFPPQECEFSFYDTTADAVTRLIALMDIVEENGAEYKRIKQSAWDCTARYDWANMGTVYDECFQDIARGETMTEIGNRIELNIHERNQSRQRFDDKPGVEGSGCEYNECSPIIISDSNDERVQLYKPKSLRDHKLFNSQVSDLRKKGLEPSIHGGRRAMVRMMEAIDEGSMSIVPISFMTNKDLYHKIFEPKMESFKSRVYVTENQELLNNIRGQKLNSGDSVLAVVSFPQSSTLDKIIANPPILILEDVRNAENVGSILRTAFCLGITSVVASPTSWSALKDTRAARCSMGTIYYHRFFQADENLSETIQQIQQLGNISVYGVEIGDRAVPITPHGTNNRWAAILGNEDTGLSSAVADVVDEVVFIPQQHGDSLNVGHAAAITLFELGRENPQPVHDGKAGCP